MTKVFPGTCAIRHTGDLRLAPDLFISRYVTVAVHSKRQKFTLRRAIKATPGSREMKFYNNSKNPIIHFRRGLRMLGLTRYEAKGTYLARRRADEISVDLTHKLRVREGLLVPWTRRRWSPVFRRDTSIRVAFEMARKGTTITKLKKLAEEYGVTHQWLLHHVKSEDTHGCKVVISGDKIKLFTPSEAKHHETTV